MTKKNKDYGNNYGQQFNRSEELKVAQVGGNGVETDIDADAWGRQKVIIDTTLFHSLFTFNIPNNWLIFEDGSEIANSLSSRVYSSYGQGIISSGANLGEKAFLRGKRHPRYQPNRGHLFSTAFFLPSPNATGIRKIGLLNTIVEVCFMLENGTLYAYIEDNSVEKIKTEIDLTQIDLTVDDLQYGHLFDIQYQWRGVGEYFFYIDQKLVYKTNFLGTNTSLTIANPALSAGFYSENTDGTEVQIKAGCVDITSEGGIIDEAQYRSATNSTVKTISTANYPVLIIRSKGTYNGLPNTRDLQAYRVTGNADQRVFMKAYYTRDASAITGGIFNDLQSDSTIEYDVSATAIDTAKCQLLWNKRIEANASGIVDLPSDRVDFYLTSGDYLIITMERENPSLNAGVSCFFELGEEI